MSPRGGYLAFLGRISREKRPDRAIEMASALGMPLKIAAKVDKADDAYFREAIVPLLARPGQSISWAKSASETRQYSWGKRARCCFQLIGRAFWLGHDRMACATPVLAFRCGSAPEIVDQRVTGCLVGSLDEAIRVMPELLRIDRRGVRRLAERLSAQRMANDYLDVYRSLNGSAEAGSSGTVCHAAST